MCWIFECFETWFSKVSETFNCSNTFFRKVSKVSKISNFSNVNFDLFSKFRKVKFVKIKNRRRGPGNDEDLRNNFHKIKKWSYGKSYQLFFFPGSTPQHSDPHPCIRPRQSSNSEANGPARQRGGRRLYPQVNPVVRGGGQASTAQQKASLC